MEMREKRGDLTSVTSKLKTQNKKYRINMKIITRLYLKVKTNRLKDQKYLSGKSADIKNDNLIQIDNFSQNSKL